MLVDAIGWEALVQVPCVHRPRHVCMACFMRVVSCHVPWCAVLPYACTCSLQHQAVVGFLSWQPVLCHMLEPAPQM